MRNLVLLVLVVLFMGSCQKVVEQTQLNALMKLITNGQWKVTTYKQDGVDVTSQFEPYSFQFKESGTVDAIKNGQVDKTGTWVGNTTNLSIESSFGNVEPPPNLLNAI